MLHFVVYHNRQKMGKKAKPRQLHTSKKHIVNNPNFRGSVVWCIEGVGEKYPKDFFLAHVFIVDRIEKSRRSDFCWVAYGSTGHEFEQREKLNELGWFLDLKKKSANFVDLRQITDEKYISEFLKRAKREGYTPDAS